MIAANINQPRPRVALLGAGTMGAGMAHRLLELGFSVDVWNRTPGNLPLTLSGLLVACLRADERVDATRRRSQADAREPRRGAG